MNFPCQIYAIYPYDENGQVVGAYVGSAHDVEVRISAHVNTKKGQEELHRLMKENGFTFQILGIAQTFEDRHLEYDWIDFFLKKTEVHLFNNLVTGGSAEEICKGFSNPIWNGKSVVWEMKPKKVMSSRAFTLFAKEHGYTLTQIAQKVGMRVQNFNRRLDGAYQFTSQQLETLKSLFPNESPEVIEGFITQKGET